MGNPKRRLDSDLDMARCRELASNVQYVGSPYHKKNPGNFGLTPPSKPRPDATLCDEIGLYHKELAQQYLENGLLRGMVSAQKRNNWPQNIWAVTDNGKPLEAQLDNQQQGTYHGYPLSSNDAFGAMILAAWEHDDAGQ